MTIIKYLKSLSNIFIGLFITALVITIMNYFNLFSSNTIKWFRLLFIIVSLYIGGFYVGKKSSSKGYLEGLKLSGILILILFMISYLGFGKGLHLKNLIYYLIVIGSCVLGSITGINKRLKN